jgi:asparagine synthetase B (glutamine-hydrolysing)
MCGIAGWIAGTGAKPDREVLGRMTRALAHRGPDAEASSSKAPPASVTGASRSSTSAPTRTSQCATHRAAT